jgi:hypothetical protein
MRSSDLEPTTATDEMVEPAVTGTQSVFRALSILHAFAPLKPRTSLSLIASRE